MATDLELLVELLEGAWPTALREDELLVLTLAFLEVFPDGLWTVLRSETLFVGWAGAFRSTCRLVVAVLWVGVLETFLFTFVLVVPALLPLVVLLWTVLFV